MESVFDDDIYAWFEPLGDDSLYCAFATGPGYLLGENVRNWLRETRQALDFVYCERMGNQRAVVLVIDGQVIKDALVGGYELSVEMRHAIDRLDKATAGGYDVFLHGIAVQELQLTDFSRVAALEDSVLDWMRAAPGPLPELHPASRAIGEIDVVAKRRRQLRIARSVGLTVASITIATLGVYWWMHRTPPAPPGVATPAPTSIEVINAKYGALLRTPDAAEVILAVHRAYRLFLGDPAFGEFLDVSKLQWSRADGRLTIETSLPREVAAARSNEIPDVLQDHVRQRAMTRGWGVNFSGLDATFSLPVVASNRVNELRLPKPTAKSHRWHESRLRSELEKLGSVTSALANRNDVYLEDLTVWEVRNLEWVAGDTATWLAKQLAGGPLVLESVVLEAGSGATMDGEIRFTTLWCVPARGSTRQCEFENA